MKEFVPPAVGFPYNKMGQSASGIATDSTRGKFGPFANQLFVGDQTWSTVMRVYLEKVNGVYQGACFSFREGLDSGTLSLEFTPEGHLFAGGQVAWCRIYCHPRRGPRFGSWHRRGARNAYLGISQWARLDCHSTRCVGD